jgi:hypothetical protein
MAESTYRQDFCPQDRAEQQTQQPSTGISMVTPLVQSTPTGACGNKGVSLLSPEHLKAELEDAARLIRYAADVGIEVEDDVRQHVVAATMAASGGWAEAHSLNLLSALTKLSARLKPVSGESLRACVYSIKASRTFCLYRRVAIILAIFILPFSVAAFVALATCEAIRKDIDLANALAVTLTRERPLASANQPSNTQNVVNDGQRYSEKELKDLQQFAATIRAIDARAKQLKFFAVYAVPDPYASFRGDGEKLKELFELPASLSNLSEAATDKITVYQNVRHFAQSVQEAVSTIFGAIASCILPMLYALLGACAYLIRSFEEQIKMRSFTGVDKPTARFLIAGIGGFVVGLFGNFGAGPGTSLPPLAIAFLVGYAVDVFFSFLEGLLHTFGKSQGDMTSNNKTAARP